MNHQQKEKFLRIISNLIEEGKRVLETEFTGDDFGISWYVDAQLFYRWWGKIISFGHQLGSAAQPWKIVLFNDEPNNGLGFTKKAFGILEGIREELENDHLSIFSQIVRAETLADLLDQADYLLANEYHLAAGVIARAVLEEHLRNTCEAIGCMPDKQKPTINDFNQALYKENHYNKVKMKQIDALTAIGNAAAHNSDEFHPDDAKRLIADLPGVIDSTQI